MPFVPLRHLVTQVPIAEAVHVGSPVRINRESVGRVQEVVGLPCNSGLRLTLEIARGDAPLPTGLVAQIRPDGLFGDEYVALVLPDTGAREQLMEGAQIPGLPRAATAVMRHRAARIVLPVIGLPALAAFVPKDSGFVEAPRGSRDSSSCR